MKEKMKEFWSKHGDKVLIVGGCIMTATAIAIIALQKNGGTSFANFSDMDILNYLKTVKNKGSVILPSRLNQTTWEVLQDTLMEAATNKDPEVGFIMKPNQAIKVLETVVGKTEA